LKEQGHLLVKTKRSISLKTKRAMSNNLNNTLIKLAVNWTKIQKVVEPVVKDVLKHI